MATAHLIFGMTGAGKTTAARRLAIAHDACRFSIDEWMAALFGADQPTNLTFDWAIERVDRCYVQIWSVARQLLLLDQDVVLDLGFDQRASRDRFRGLAAEVGANTVLHLATAPLEVRVERIRRRNLDGSEQFAFEVTDDMVEFMDGRFEPPGDDEHVADR